jgi:hypothetical protein
VQRGPSRIGAILNDRQPGGPVDTESLIDAEHPELDQFFDRSNLIYAQTREAASPSYIIGRKGAGKTAFLLGASDSHRQERLRTSTIYSELVATLRRYADRRAPLFTEQVADIWHALFDHIAIAHGCRTASRADRPNELQTMWDYLDQPGGVISGAMGVAEGFLDDLQRRVDDTSIFGLREVIDGMSRGGVAFADARKAMRVVLEARSDPVTVVMDNLEDLHTRIDELRPVLGGLFHFVGRTSEVHRERRPFGLRICLPSELFGTIHELSSNPEKDFRGNYLTIYWTARELLHLAGARLRMFLAWNHPDELAVLLRRVPAAEESDVALLRATLPGTVRGGLGVDEDPVAYLLRHTQLLPRHLIGILNQVYTDRDSDPWNVTPKAILRGTRQAERIVVEGILAAHREAYPLAQSALGKLSDRLGVCFPASELHKTFNREGIRKQTGLEFGEFLTMLLEMGVLGLKVDTTGRYNKAEFRYTFDSTLNAEEDEDELCVHPLFTRYLFERTIPRLRRNGALPTYPYGCDLDGDYRRTLGYTGT